MRTVGLAFSAADVERERVLELGPPLEAEQHEQPLLLHVLEHRNQTRGLVVLRLVVPGGATGHDVVAREGLLVGRVRLVGRLLSVLWRLTRIAVGVVGVVRLLMLLRRIDKGCSHV